jgi:pilus assembly protein CpaB
MSARQLIVLAIAAIAAVGALFIIRAMGAQRAAPEVETSAIAGEQILVAARDIQQGVALQPGDLKVALFPTETVTPAFIRVGSEPSAQSDYVGAVTRRTFAQGEPITQGSIVQPDGRGFMAAQLEPGYRAIAVEIEASTAVGGFLQPNDRVDVIVTTTAAGENGRQMVLSDIVLQDVRVLALGEHTNGQTAGAEQERIEASVAVLELTAEDARALALADEAGQISLALRGVQAETVGIERSDRSGGGGGVRVHAFGTVSGGG